MLFLCSFQVRIILVLVVVELRGDFDAHYVVRFFLALLFYLVSRQRLILRIGYFICFDIKGVRGRKPAHLQDSIPIGGYTEEIG